MAWGRRKFGNTKVRKHGYSFDSKLESALHDELKTMEQAGLATDIKQQVNVHLTPAKILYKADFSYIEVATGNTIYCEAKGLVMPVWAIKKRLWVWFGPGPLHVFGGSYKSVRLIETIIPKPQYCPHCGL